MLYFSAFFLSIAIMHQNSMPGSVFRPSFDVIRKLNWKYSLECSRRTETKRSSREQRHVSIATPQKKKKKHALTTYLSILYIVFVAPPFPMLIFPYFFCTSEFILCITAASYPLRLRINESFSVLFFLLMFQSSRGGRKKKTVRT